MRYMKKDAPHALKQEWLSIAQVAEIFEVSYATAARWGRTQVIPSVRVGRVVRFHQADVEKALEPLSAEVAS